MFDEERGPGARLHVIDTVAIGKAFMVEGRWEGRDPQLSALSSPFFLVFTFWDGRIVEMQECVSRDKALRYARSRAA